LSDPDPTTVNGYQREIPAKADLSIFVPHEPARRPDMVRDSVRVDVAYIL
jgi:hypothetical protein